MTDRPDARADASDREPRTALLAGATGLVGGHVLDLLLASPRYGRVVALVRRPLERGDSKLRCAVVDFDRLEDPGEAFEDPAARVDDVFCCLGTTIKKAGSEQAFRRVDHDYVASLARLGRAHGAGCFGLISSVGADAGSGNFYLRVKGEAEDSVEACAYPRLHILRPGLLDGPRQERRLGERLALAVGRPLAPLFVGGLRKYRPVPVGTVAAALVAAAAAGAPGRHVHTYDGILRLARDVRT